MENFKKDLLNNKFFIGFIGNAKSEPDRKKGQKDWLNTARCLNLTKPNLGDSVVLHLVNYFGDNFNANDFDSNFFIDIK